MLSRSMLPLLIVGAHAAAFAALRPATFPDSTPLLYSAVSSLETRLEFPKSASLRSLREWDIKGADSQPTCHVQVTRLRGVSLADLSKASIRLSGIAPVNMDGKMGVFGNLAYQEVGGTQFAGRLTCFPGARAAQPLTLGDIRQAFERTAHLDKQPVSLAMDSG